MTAALALAGGVLAGCSSDEGSAGGTDDPATSTTAAAPAASERPDGPAADLSEELTVGQPFVADLSGDDLAEAGYVQHEYVAAGTATSYRANGELPADGRFDLVEGDTAEYRTRIVVRRPADAADFNGTVLLEWLNVSGGVDANPDWVLMREEILRGGYAWVGVSAQHIGIEGGPVAVGVEGTEGLAGQGLKAIDEERYGTLSHPGDAYSYDIYTQVARALREPGQAAMGGLEPARILAVGESQSAFALTTYVNGVQPLTRQFDGFLVHSRGGAAAPLGEPGTGIDMTATIVGAPTRLRTDGDVPILVLQTEGDLLSVLGYHAASQPDEELLRVWEVTGAAHADRHLVGPLADQLDCGVPINDGPHHFVAKAALRHLDRWVRDGTPPPEAPRIEIDDGPSIVRDDNGIAVGGVRTPVVDAPVEALSGDPGPEPSVVCLLMGSTLPIPQDRLAEMFPSRELYLEKFEAAADAAIAAGFVLEEDREALLATAKPELLGA